MIGRFPITNLMPAINFGGEFIPSKAVIGEWLPISATITRDGHDDLSAGVRLYAPDGKLASTTTMREIWPGTDRYEAWVKPEQTGKYLYEVEAFDNPIATWLHVAEIKVPVGIDLDLTYLTGVELLTALILQVKLEVEEERLINDLISLLQKPNLAGTEFITAIKTPKIQEIFTLKPLKKLVTVSEKIEIEVEGRNFGFAAWYEFFPRSEGAYKSANGEIKSGNFKTAIASLDRVAKMGFDVLYLPPIHPIGVSFRKGKNNSLNALPGDVGVPWAIGSELGGHKSINPELGSEDDFAEFVKAAKNKNINVALDLALQASPDHPWVREHPEWFTKRADGSIAYAENPPKKYQDIYPINFDLDLDGLVDEVISIIEYWGSFGIEIFRVDNPHTKPTVFWHRVIQESKAKNPNLIFLSEAFTRPAIMHDLAKAGFSQSYTYFTWRTSKSDLIAYGKEISQETAHFFRPNFWVNTPDILAFHLQHASANLFKMRALLASTMAPLWGMYAGYELCENIPLGPGKEEYIDSEKYEIKLRDFSSPNIMDYISKLNEIRKTSLGLQQLRTLVFHPTDSDDILVYSKSDGKFKNIVVVNLKPDEARSTYIHFDTFYLDGKSKFLVRNLFNGERMEFQKDQFIEIRPENGVGMIFEVEN